MNVVFVSNTYTIHQAPLSEALYRRLGDGYTFIETVPLTQERRKMNWQISQYPAFVHCVYESGAEVDLCQQQIDEADVVIWGMAPWKMLSRRLRRGGLTLHYSERLFKKGMDVVHFLPRAIKHYRANKPAWNQYLLCSSAYAAVDYGKMGCYKGKTFKWGYFPETKSYDLAELFAKKEPATIFWAARMIDCKHPELAVGLGAALKSRHIPFEMRIAGGGPMEEQLRQIIRQNGLETQVKLLGMLTPQQVREQMERADIFIATSDYNEGWGAVINEAMNSGCAVVASHAMGAVPFLIQHGTNGMIFESENLDDLCRQVEKCLTGRAFCKRLGEKAYETVTTIWSAECAADALIELMDALCKGSAPRRKGNAPCCIAEPIQQEEMYRVIVGEQK